jgi:hypothetical protein
MPLIGFLGFLIFSDRTCVKAPSTQALGIPPNRVFPWGLPLGGATRGFACTHGEGERDTTSFCGTRHYFPSPPNLSYLSLLSLFLSLYSPKPPDDFSFTADNCTDGGGPAVSPLPRRFLASSSWRPCLASKGGKHLAAHQLPPANVGKHPQSPSCTFSLPS